MPSLTAEERETHIFWSDADEFATVVTHQRTWLTSLSRNTSAEQVGETDVFGGKTYRVPKNLVSKIRNGSHKQRRPMSEEARKAASDRMAAARAAKAAG